MDISRVVAVVLAGGFGTRVRHLLPGLPKPMAPVAGRPFLEWVVRFLARQGIRKVILSTGYLAEVIERYFQGEPVPNVATRCVRETEPLGTAGGFAFAASASDEKPEAWIILNGDSLVLADLAPAAQLLEEPKVAGVIVGCRMPDVSRYGTLAAGAGGELHGFMEKRPGKGVINAGIYFLKAEAVRQFPAQRPLSFEQEVFPEMLRKGAVVKVCVVDAPFLDIGTPESLQAAQSFIEQNRHRF